MYFRTSFFLLTVTIFLRLCAVSAQRKTPAIQVVDSGYLFSDAPFEACHASTIASINKDTTFYAWFGGDHEGAENVKIWGILQNIATGISGPIFPLAEGKDSAGNAVPCWNPVLFKTGKGVLFLDYKVGKNPREWWAERKISYDNGLHWTAAEKLPKGFLGPIKNKPVQLANGNILYPSSTESMDEKSWQVHLEMTDADGHNWQYIPIDCDTFGVIQPSILHYPNGNLQLLCRSRQNAVVATWSSDNGQSWGKLSKLDLPNPNSGTDAVTLKNGWQLLVYNPLRAGNDWWEGRSTLQLAASRDGIHWKDVLTLEQHKNGEYSYPAIIQAEDGSVLISYTYARKRIKYVRLKVK